MTSALTFVHSGLEASIPAPSCCSHVCPGCPCHSGEAGPGPGDPEEGVRGQPGLWLSPPRPLVRSASCPSHRWPGGFRVTGLMSGDPLHGGEQRRPLPVPSSPGTWFCSWAEAACWSLSRRASLSRRDASSSCSRALSSCSRAMASTILCTTGAAPGGPDRLEHLPRPESRPPMSKAVAGQQGGGRGPPWTRRGAVPAGPTAPSHRRGQERRLAEQMGPGGAWAAAWAAVGFWGRFRVARVGGGQMALPGWGLRKAAFTEYSL